LRQAVIPPDFGIFIFVTTGLLARSSAPTLASCCRPGTTFGSSPISGFIRWRGFLLAYEKAFWDAIERQRRIALLLAAVFFASFIALRGSRDIGMPLRIYGGIAYGFYQWLCMVAVLGFARRWLNRDSATRRYLTDAIFPYYIVHQTAIIMIAHALHGRDLPVAVEASIVVAGTAAACMLSYEIVRRVAVLRPLFGLRKAGSEPAMPLRTGHQPAG
jgi:hypothetical protein